MAYSNDDGPNHTKYPGANGGHRHVRVIRVGHGRTDFGVRRVVLQDTSDGFILVNVGIIKGGEGRIQDVDFIGFLDIDDLVDGGRAPAPGDELRHGG